jgi:hypothetical protein
MGRVLLMAKKTGVSMRVAAKQPEECGEEQTGDRERFIAAVQLLRRCYPLLDSQPKLQDDIVAFLTDRK